MVVLIHGGLTSAGTMRFDGGLTWGLLAPARRFNGSCSSGHRQLLRPCVAQSVAQSVEQSVAQSVEQSVEQSVAHEGTLERLLQAPGRQWAHTWGAERGDFKSGQGSARSGFKSIAPECESGGNLWGWELWLIDWLGPIPELPLLASSSSQLETNLGRNLSINIV